MNAHVQARDDQVLVVARVADDRPRRRRCGAGPRTGRRSRLELGAVVRVVELRAGDGPRPVDGVQVERRRRCVRCGLRVASARRAARWCRTSCRGRGTGRGTSSRRCGRVVAVVQAQHRVGDQVDRARAPAGPSRRAGRRARPSWFSAALTAGVGCANDGSANIRPNRVGEVAIGCASSTSAATASVDPSVSAPAAPAPTPPRNRRRLTLGRFFQRLLDCVPPGWGPLC